MNKMAGDVINYKDKFGHVVSGIIMSVLDTGYMTKDQFVPFSDVVKISREVPRKRKEKK